MKAIISGASRGIGKATAFAFAKAGFDLLLLSRSKDDLRDLKQKLEQENSLITIQISSIDLGNTNEIKELHLHSLNENHIVLVNNVGSYQNDQASKLSQEELQKMLAVNLYGTIELTKQLMPSLRRARKAQIVNISSINGLAADSNATAYSISKHALKAWNDALREELRANQIKVTAFYPGPVNTTSWEGVEVDHAAMIQADDIAKLILQLNELSDGALVEEIRISPLNFNPSSSLVDTPPL